MTTRTLHAKTALTPECRRKIELALSRYAPMKNRLAWNQKVTRLLTGIEDILAAIPDSWAWPQAPDATTAVSLVQRLSNILFELEQNPSVSQTLDDTYLDSLPASGNDPHGHDAHIRAADKKIVQFGELVWRMQHTAICYLANPRPTGRRSYDKGLLWIVREIIDSMKRHFPKVPAGKGNHSVLPVIVDAVLSHQVTLATRQDPAKMPRARDLINAVTARRNSESFGQPPSQYLTTTTSTTAL